MCRRVLKFGGSVLKNSSDLKKLLNICQTYHSAVVVVSAFYKITEKLIEAMETIPENEYQIESLIDELRRFHSEILHKSVNSKQSLEKASVILENRLSELKQLLTGYYLLKDIHSTTYDRIVSFGEKLSSLIVCEGLKDMNLNAVEKLPEEIGLITDGVSGNATVDYTVSEENLKESLLKNEFEVIPGFYGVSPEGKINVFGRGGSDYSAAVIARCINADSVDLWKDCYGFKTADPESIPSAKSVKNLSYHEAAELAYFGAKILHPRTVDPLIEKNIPVRLFNPDLCKDAESELSRIDQNGIVKQDVIKAVSITKDVGIIRLNGSGVGNLPGLISRVSSALLNSGINISTIITSQTAINFLLSRNDIDKGHAVILSLDLHQIENIQVIDSIALICAVGEGMMEKPGIAARLLKSVADCGANILVISLGASDTAFYIVVSICESTKTIQSIHREFFS